MTRSTLTITKRLAFGYAIAALGWMWVFLSTAPQSVFFIYSIGMFSTLVYISFDRARHEQDKKPLEQSERRHLISRIGWGWIIACISIVLYGLTAEDGSSWLMISLYAYVHMVFSCVVFYTAVPLLQPQQKGQANEVG